jgi:feruloyl esterase
MKFYTLVSALSVLQWTIAATSFHESCLAFNATSLLANSTLRLHEYVPANTTIPLNGMSPTCSRSSQLFSVEACRVALTVPTTNRSSVIVELFLPHNNDWTGRYLATGNGGIDGCIKYEDIAYGLSHGFATTGSNNGHNGTGGEDFLNNEDIIIDFSWRALHTAAKTGKFLTKAFYSRPIGKSYYIGCSGGGRQGIQAAELVPQDYDGILVGCPALNFNYMSAWRASFYTITGAANSTDFIQPEIWQGLIHNEVLRQCDTLDGVKDGILADPSLCLSVFRPEALLCTSATPTACLTAVQVEVVRRVFTPLYGVDGKMIYPSLSPGAETQATQRLLSGTPFPYSVDWFRYAVYSDPSWDPSTFSIHDALVAQTKNAGNAVTWPSSLSRFRDAGAKLLIFHGGADQQITHFDTERWYNYLSVRMAERSEDLDAWVRFFFVPGMGHCSGGVGAWQIGQSGAAAAGIEYASRYNVLAAIVEWVEGGTAPEEMVGTRFVNDTVAKGVDFQRVHCRYPLRSVYMGGEAGGLENWGCR